MALDNDFPGACQDVGTSKKKKMVRAAGFEPANRGFSSLLIVAFCCIYLLRFIRDNACVCKCFVVSSGNYEQKYLCGVVR